MSLDRKYANNKKFSVTFGNIVFQYGIDKTENNSVAKHIARDRYKISLGRISEHVSREQNVGTLSLWQFSKQIVSAVAIDRHLQCKPVWTIALSRVRLSILQKKRSWNEKYVNCQVKSAWSPSVVVVVVVVIPYMHVHTDRITRVHTHSRKCIAFALFRGEISSRVATSGKEQSDTRLLW